MKFGNEVPVHSQIKSWLFSFFQLCRSPYRFCLPSNQCQRCQTEHWWDPWTLSSSKHFEHKCLHLSSNKFFSHSSLCDSLTSLHFCSVSLSYKYSMANALGCVVSSLWWFHLGTKTDSHQRYQQKANTTMCVKDAKCQHQILPTATAWKLTTHWIPAQTPVSLISAKYMTVSVLQWQELVSGDSGSSLSSLQWQKCYLAWTWLVGWGSRWPQNHLWQQRQACALKTTKSSSLQKQLKTEKKKLH